MTDQLDGEQLLNDVEDAIRKYCCLPARAAYPAVALYIAYTHAAHCFQYAPRLLITSAEKRSGKTRLLDIVVALTARPLVAANATVPAIFRSLGDGEPRTLVFDEADTIFGTKLKAEQNEDLRGLINAGFQQGTPVLRTVGPQHVPTEFDVFAPVVMAAIGTLPDTIQDRAVNIRMKRKKPTDKVAQYRLRRDRPALTDLQARLSLWAASQSQQLAAAYPETPLDDRAADLWEPLLAVADAAGGHWPTTARKTAVEITQAAATEDKETSIGIELLTDLQTILELRKSDFIKTADILASLTGLEDSRWKDEGITGKRLADLLRAYSVFPTATKTARGYKRAPLEDAFARYLPIDPLQASHVSSSAPASQTTGDTSVTGDTLTRHPSPTRHPDIGTSKPKMTHMTD